MGSVRTHITVSTLTGALATALVPLTPFLIFNAAQSGRFTIIYTAFLMTWSAALSSVCDVRLRVQLSGEGVDVRAFNTTLSLVALLGGVVAVPVSLVVGAREVTAATSIAVAAGVLRTGLRFVRVMGGVHLGRVILSDLATSLIFVFGAVLSVTMADSNSFGLVVWGWAISNVAGLLVYLPIQLGSPKLGIVWVRQFWPLALPLLGDTFLLDAGGSLAPMLMLVWLTIGQFGVYRAVSSVGSPVNLLLDPIRPKISALSSRGLFRPGPLGLLFIAAALLAGMTWGGADTDQSFPAFAERSW